MKSRKRATAPRQQLTAIDLFSGCGGLSLGLKKAGFKIVAAVEIDPFAADTYKLNHPDVPVQTVDVRKIKPSQLMRQLGMCAGDLDLLAGCPPCQGFSTLRTRNRSRQNRDARNNLVDEILRFARTFRPKAIMMENVPELARYKPFISLCEGLSKLGYILNHEIKDAAKYGVPQRRRRLILLAGLSFEIPFAAESSAPRTVRDAIAHLPRPSMSKDSLHNAPENRSRKVARLIRDIPKDGGSRGDLPLSRQLNCHKKTDGFKDIYGRMAWDEVAPTITSGCFNPSKGRFLHPSQNRAISMREAALLQGFPKNYKFNLALGKSVVALMIGNALPPEFIRRHALQVRKAVIEGREKDSN